MTVKELRDILNKMEEHYDNNRVCVRILKRGVMGGSPCVSVRAINNGFDWDSGKCIIYTDPDVTEVTKDEKRDINIDNILD